MVRRADDDRVDGFVIQHTAVIGNGFRVGCQLLFGLRHTGRVHIIDSGELASTRFKRGSHQVLTT